MTVTVTINLVNIRKERDEAVLTGEISYLIRRDHQIIDIDSSQ